KRRAPVIGERWPLHLLLFTFYRLGRAFPALDRLLAPARHGQLPRRGIVRDDRARPDRGVLADRYRRDQRRVRADEGAVADHGAMLVGPVVIAGDGAGADVDVTPDAGVADVGQMIDLAALAE